MPSGSSAGFSAERDSGTSAMTATNPSKATGTFIRKIHPHQKFVSSQPPKIGPTGRAMKLAADQTPTARGRSLSENRTVSTESAMTTTAEPAAPRMIRPAMNSAEL